MNISFVDGQPDMSSLPLAPGSGTQYHPEYVNIAMVAHDSRSRTGEVERRVGNGTVVAGTEHRRSATVMEESSALPQIPVKQNRSDSHVPMSQFPRPRNQLPPRRVVECEQCSDLKEWLLLWQLGVSGLTRQYSQILAQLNHARDAATIIECKMREGWTKGEVGGDCGRGLTESEGDERGRVGSVRTGSVEVKVPRRRTILGSIGEEDSPAHTPTHLQRESSNMADQMYPSSDPSETNEGENPASLLTNYEEHFTELSLRLSRAIDLCQQLAVASFKTHTPDLLRKKELGRKSSSPLSLTPDISKHSRKKMGSSWRPLVRVGAVDESEDVRGETKRKRGILTRMETEPAITFGKEEEGKKMDKSLDRKEKREKARASKNSPAQSGKTGLTRSKTRYVPKKDQPARSSMAGDLFGGAQQEIKPVKSHVMLANEAQGGAGQVGGEGAGPTAAAVGSGGGSEDGAELTMSGNSTFSDTDVKQVCVCVCVCVCTYMCFFWGGRGGEGHSVHTIYTHTHTHHAHTHNPLYNPGDYNRA